MISKPDGKGGLDIGGIRYMMIRPDALMGLFHSYLDYYAAPGPLIKCEIATLLCSNPQEACTEV